MRFERLGHKPVLIRELDVDGARVTTVDGDARETTTFDSADAAQQHADALTKAWRAEGYIPIKRVAAAVQEEPVRRDRRFEWTDRDRTLFREIAQKDDAVRIIDGDVIAGSDRRHEPEVSTQFSIKEASGVYDRHVERTLKEIEAARMRTSLLEVKRTIRKQKQAADRFTRNVHPELEAECMAAPDAPGPWQVYADWLLDRNDPVGEAAALAIGGDVGGAHRTLVAHFEELDGSAIHFNLRHGFLHHLEIRTADGEPLGLVDVLRRVLVSPACRFVDSIRLGLATWYYDNDWAPALSLITDAHQAPNLRVLRLDGFDDEQCMLSNAAFGDIGFAWSKLPRLEELRIRGGADGNLGDLDIPNLTTFVHESTGLRREWVDALTRVPRPHLVHLELWTGSAERETEAALAELAPIFDATNFPALRHLGIVNSELSDVIIPALATSRVLPQLDSLDLTMGIAARTTATQLVEHARHFRHLAAFDLSDNLFADDEVAELRAVLDNIITNHQREREDDFPDNPGVRYIALGE